MWLWGHLTLILGLLATALAGKKKELHLRPDKKPPSSASQGFAAYVFPLAGSKGASPLTNILLRAKDSGLGKRDVDITAEGARSGFKEGTLDQSDDGETLIFTPDEPFDTNEIVTVTARQTDNGQSFQWSFKTASGDMFDASKETFRINETIFGQALSEDGADVSLPQRLAQNDSSSSRHSAPLNSLWETVFDILLKNQREEGGGGEWRSVANYTDEDEGDEGDDGEDDDYPIEETDTAAEEPQPDTDVGYDYEPTIGEFNDTTMTGQPQEDDGHDTWHDESTPTEEAAQKEERDHEKGLEEEEQESDLDAEAEETPKAADAADTETYPVYDPWDEWEAAMGAWAEAETDGKGDNKTGKGEARLPLSEYLTLPPDHPQVIVTQPRQPGTAAGHIFTAHIRHPEHVSHDFLLILDGQSGDAVWWHRFDYSNQGWHGWSVRDLKLHDNGQVTYHDRARNGWVVLNSRYKEVDFITPKYGYASNGHGIQIDKKGHRLILANDKRHKNMAAFGGSPAGQALGVIIQELEPNGRTVFQWSSWDHLYDQFKITEQKFDRGQESVDHLHANSVDWTPDGHILVSFRHLSQVIKVDRKTGKVIWRFGGTKETSNSFDLDNPFYWQHSARMTEPGVLTVYDNHNEHPPEESRALEFHLDEKSMKAKLVWEYKHDPPRYGYAMGSVQTLSNGNKVISWAGVEPQSEPFYTEVSRDGSKLLEFRFANGMAYRALKSPWASRGEGKPTLVLNADTDPPRLHFSWNGATEVATWKVKAGQLGSPLQLVTSVPREHFETIVTLPHHNTHSPVNSCVRYKAVALDKGGTSIGRSNVVDSPWCVSRGAMCVAAEKERHDCTEGQGFITQEQCEQRGCCYRPPGIAGGKREGQPWCFRPLHGGASGKDGQQQGNVCAAWGKETRAACGTPGTNKQACEARGCCWDPQGPQGQPLCFHAGDTCSVVGKRRLACGRGLGGDQCRKRGCCYDEKKEQCFLPDSTLPT
ncbi:unnamed protein product [Vitrella brassicaformis CCMP3155]|uniref:P-type domain-containing protein n=1 Tax=Vitrella brassicaformis (strain CCMP3155) TaxID=1169540 RepID=A0A0G4EX16_VITBC|nr:unnamed protein product [Vitrella brassicaformis CCMP3155]|eukprot:CEM03206.1 unnamed protein product [Vitrella brassicaformis CCMP3155]